MHLPFNKLRTGQFKAHFMRCVLNCSGRKYVLRSVAEPNVGRLSPSAVEAGGGIVAATPFLVAWENVE